MSTVRIEPYPNRTDCIRMVWEERVLSADVTTAFRHIQQHMDAHDHPLTVVVILHPKTNFPLSITVAHALPVYRDERLRAWLVVGKSTFAKIIERVLSYQSQRRTVYWFDTEDEALTYLQTLTTNAS